MGHIRTNEGYLNTSSMWKDLGIWGTLASGCHTCVASAHLYGKLLIRWERPAVPVWEAILISVWGKGTGRVGPRGRGKVRAR